MSCLPTNVPYGHYYGDYDDYGPVVSYPDNWADHDNLHHRAAQDSFASRFRVLERKMDYLVEELASERIEKIIQNPPTSNELDENPTLRRAWNDLVRFQRERNFTKQLAAAEMYLSIRKLIYGEENT